MKLARKFAIGFLDFVLGGVFGNAQSLVGILHRLTGWIKGNSIDVL
jgi:hypothetical protein